jgi:hypothetical protein
MKVTFYKRILSNMLLNTRITFYDELSVFLLRFPPRFRLTLHLLDPNPGSQSNADQMRIRIRNTAATVTLLYCPKLTG